MIANPEWIDLKPHSCLKILPRDLRIQAAITQQQKQVTLDFHLLGDLDEVKFPDMKAPTERMNNLWEHTCLEAFFAWDRHPYYWELNLSPSGDWNLYSFRKYRIGQKLERKVDSIVYQVSKWDSRQYRAAVTLDLEKILPSHPVQLEFSLTSVIETQVGSKSYWAFSHCGSQPDFHLRDSFVIHPQK